MERSAALKKLRKLLGNSLGYRVDPKAPSAEDRWIAGVKLPEAIEARNKVRDLKEARSNAILAADSEYQGLKAALKTATDRVNELSSIRRHFKFTVGVSHGMFFHVSAEGDSWEDVIAKVEKEKKQCTP